MDFNELARMLRMQPTVDSTGAPIDLKRPIVFDPKGYEPHTELSMTATGHELGLPQTNALYNVPTIYNGQINDPATFGGMNEIRKNVMKTPNAYKAYGNEQQAVKDAIARSKDIGNLRGDELRKAVIARYMENMQ
jgi:hypothetical protein